MLAMSTSADSSKGNRSPSIIRGDDQRWPQNGNGNLKVQGLLRPVQGLVGGGGASKVRGGAYDSRAEAGDGEVETCVIEATEEIAVRLPPEV